MMPSSFANDAISAPAMRRRGDGALRVVLALCVGLTTAGLTAHRSARGYDTWSKVESAEETRDYGQQIRDGVFGDSQKAVLERIILPQLALEANRPTLVSVRLRIRDTLTRGATVPKVYDAANTVARDFMLILVSDDKADLVVRVNAMILVGELMDPLRKPWSGSVEALAKASSDPNLPLAIRVAAMSGLVRQVAEGRGKEAAFTKAVAPVVASIITKPPAGDPTAVDWFVGRALDLAGVLGGTPEVATAAASILANKDADLDLRIRAAAALGRLGKPDAPADLAAAIKHIRSVAVEGIEQDLAAAEARRFARQLGGVGDDSPAMQPPPATGGGGVPPPGLFSGGGGLFDGPATVTEAGGDLPFMPTVIDKDAVPLLACKRDAWRLVKLADAIKPEGSAGGGIAASLAGDAVAEAVELATLLRREGLAITARPSDSSLKSALAALESLAKPAVDGKSPAGPAVPGGGSPSPFDADAPGG